MRFPSSLTAIVTASMAAAFFIALPSLPAQAAQPSFPSPQTGLMPSAVPAAWTPAVDDGEVDATAQVGNTIVIGGTFTSVGGLSRVHLAAFNATTGAISTTFAPAVTGAEVVAVIPGRRPTRSTWRVTSPRWAPRR